MINLIQGDCLEKMAELKENSVDSIVTDSPYGINFMGKKWDYDVPKIEIWKACLRVLKPGGYLLSFSGTRTQHRMVCNIEDAGFEIRDMIGWIYGSGFPKSLNISKAIDKAAGAKREIVGKKRGVNAIDEAGYGAKGVGIKQEQIEIDLTVPATPEAQKWEGWGTALKPALEPITVARKLLEEKTVAENVLKHWTGGINIDGCRIETQDKVEGSKYGKSGFVDDKRYEKTGRIGSGQGRWPANLIHDGSPEVEALFPETESGTILPYHQARESENNCMNGKNYARTGKTSIGDSGSASRFFYCAKASKHDRDLGLFGFKKKESSGSDEFRVDGSLDGKTTEPRKNHHPTVKPTDLMQYLCRLVTPKKGTALDPFMGSGSTGRAAKLEGFNFIGIEIDPDYFNIAKKRIDSILAVQDKFDW